MEDEQFYIQQIIAHCNYINDVCNSSVSICRKPITIHFTGYSQSEFYDYGQERIITEEKLDINKLNLNNIKESLTKMQVVVEMLEKIKHENI